MMLRLTWEPPVVIELLTELTKEDRNTHGIRENTKLVIRRMIVVSNGESQ